MQNDTTTVNDIVTKAAEANKANSDNGNQQNQDNNKDEKKEGETSDKKDESLDSKTGLDNANAKKEEENKSEGVVNDEKKDTSAVDALLKELGITDVSELKEKLKAPVKELTAEEKEKQDNLYKADIQRFAVEKGEMKLEDFTKLENLKSKADRDLVYDNWLKEWTEENEGNEELEDFDEAERSAKAKEDFEKEYKLSSKNEKVKARGEAKLAKEAKEMRQPLESSYNKVKESFDTEESLRKAYPDYNKTVRGFINESIPEKFDFYKGKDEETEIPIEIELTKDDKAEIELKISEKILNPETFYQFRNGKIDGLKSLAKTETDNFIWNKYKEQGLKMVADKFRQTGFEKGRIGATESFALNQSKADAATRQTSTDAKQQVLDSVRNQSR